MAAQYVSPHARNHVLVVDDDRDCADSLVEVLRVCFEIEAEPAYGGSQALNAARAHPPAAIVLDLDMPIVDGLETANDLLEAFSDHPPSLIAVTGNPDLWRAASNDRRFSDALLKPPDPQELARAVLKAAEAWRRILR
jgi:CheY-like chemotaxis protein